MSADCCRIMTMTLYRKSPKQAQCSNGAGVREVPYVTQDHIHTIIG